ncbi:hypothetical protein CKAH01_08395 [Colletotrichum kahawae]|uniref:Uncharacterized protein n=1 Tax=Colletotrichum kahawae TaxID=34407 RepID=A0AAD9Y1F4_COLKA|nr:hypothetical protein CKAH01_08395 [Colletotrichum kahawae]
MLPGGRGPACHSTVAVSVGDGDSEDKGKDKGALAMAYPDVPDLNLLYPSPRRGLHTDMRLDTQSPQEPMARKTEKYTQRSYRQSLVPSWATERDPFLKIQIPKSDKPSGRPPPSSPRGTRHHRRDHSAVSAFFFVRSEKALANCVRVFKQTPDSGVIGSLLPGQSPSIPNRMPWAEETRPRGEAPRRHVTWQGTSKPHEPLPVVQRARPETGMKLGHA